MIPRLNAQGYNNKRAVIHRYNNRLIKLSLIITK